MKLREAAQQALSAIDRALPYAPHCSEFDVLADCADDLRAALAEDALERMSEDERKLGIQMQPVQEPVAWMVYTLDGKSVCVTDNPADFTAEHRALPLYTSMSDPQDSNEPVAWLYASSSGPVVLHRIKPVGVAKASFVQAQLDNDIKAAKEYPNAHSCTPLYTAPPQRKPLTEEEIVVLFNKLVQDRPAWPERRYRDFARYVERAHGIGGSNA